MISLLLSVVLSSIYFLGQVSFIGIIACVWCLYMLAFANFSTIPAQVSSLKLYIFKLTQIYLRLSFSSLVLIPVLWLEEFCLQSLSRLLF